LFFVIVELARKLRLWGPKKQSTPPSSTLAFEAASHIVSRKKVQIVIRQQKPFPNDIELFWNETAAE
jgi:hypothetical protein